MKHACCFAITAITVVLSACGASGTKIETTSEISEWPHFSLQVNDNFQERIVRDDESIALTTYDTSTAERKQDDFSIWIFPKAQSCTSLGIDEIQSANIDSDEAQWGKVKDYDMYDDLLDPDCRIMPTEKGIKPKGTAYAFCAEKNNKMVIICIKQMTDDEAMAKEIFESFRWTK